jgi:hypothetical protein
LYEEMGAHRHTRVNDAATFSDDDLRSFPRPDAAAPLPEAAVTPDAAADFVVVDDAGCFQVTRSTSTARWYHGDFLDDRPDLAPPSFLRAPPDIAGSVDTIHHRHNSHEQ